jgi:hypothetical protein
MAGTSTPFKQAGRRPLDGITSHHSHRIIPQTPSLEKQAPADPAESP